MRRLRAVQWILPVLALLGLAAGAAYYWRRDYRVAPAAAMGAATLANPEMRRLSATVTATGTIRLRVGSEVRVGSQLSGVVRKLYVTVGSHVNKDDVIAEIDPCNLEA